MNKVVLFVIIIIITSCKEQKSKLRYLPDSNANINHLTVVMPEKSWAGGLGKKLANLETPMRVCPLMNRSLHLSTCLLRFLRALPETVGASYGLSETP